MDLHPIPHPPTTTPRATDRRYPGGPTASEISEDSEAAVEAVEGESSGTASQRLDSSRIPWDWGGNFLGNPGSGFRQAFSVT